MADRPTASTSRSGRPRMRSKSAHLSSCILVAPKIGKLRTTSVQRVPMKSKGAGKGMKTPKRSNKPVVVVSSDSEDLEVDFPSYHPNQPHEVPTEIPEEPNPPAKLQLRNNKNQSTLLMLQVKNHIILQTFQ